MITLERLRQISPTLAVLSDDELTVIRTELYDLGNLAFKAYRMEKVPKNHIRVVAFKNEKSIIKHHE